MISYIRHTGSIPPSIDALLDESEREGFSFLRRLIDDWQSGTNRFESAGEVFMICQENNETIAVGGLNLDPYADDPQIGRIRHVYVSRGHRRRGFGRMLVERLIDEARDRFRELRLRTNTSTGDVFYQSLGFTRLVDSEFATHVLSLVQE